MIKRNHVLILVITLSLGLSGITFVSSGPNASAEVTWEKVSSQSKTIEIPPGESYFAYLDRDSGKWVEMTLPSKETGLSENAIEALAQVPDWLYNDLAKKFAELGDTMIDVGDYATPIFADMDADGDLDLSLGSESGNLFYYENIGTRFRSIFVQDTTMYEQINIDIADSLVRTSLAIADMDGDGDNDLFMGESEGTLWYIENFGDESSASWSSYNLLAPIDVGENSHPALADMDADGDYDLVIGAEDGNFYYYENTGSSTEPDWTEYVVDPFNDLYITQGNSKPVFADLDDDDDLDMSSGETQGILHYFENRGNAEYPAFVQEDTMYLGITVPFGTAPVLSDIDGDFCYELSIGVNNGALYYYENTGSASNADWMIWSSYQIVEGYEYYPKDVFLNYRDDYHMTRYADLILNADLKFKDEIGFAIAHTPTENLKALNNNQIQLFVDNAELIYEIDQYLDYVEVIEKDDYTTTRYKFGEPGNTIDREIPRDVYYWYIVLPKITDENVYYIHPEDTDPDHPTDPADGGRFWREYLFYHADESYPPDNSGATDDGVDDYPVPGVQPSLLKDLLKGVEVLFNGTLWHAPAGNYSMFQYTGEDNIRPFDYGEHAVIRVSNWVGKTLILNQQEVSDDERPLQPVRIAHHHNGNCGELQDLTTAAARTALIPAAGVLLLGEDHVWNEFYENGWHQWDNYWSDGGSIIDDFDNYWVGWNQRGGSGIWKHVGDDDTWEVTDRYIPDEDLNYVTVRVMDNNGDPVDGARVLVITYWLTVDIEGYQIQIPFPGIWNYTDSNGETLVKLATQEKSGGNRNFTFRIISKIGSAESGKLELEHGQDYTFSFYLEGSAPNPTLNTDLQSNPNPPNPEYRLGVSYNVKSGVQHPRHPLTGNHHAEDIPPERPPDPASSDFSGNHIDSFITTEEEFNDYLKGYRFDSYELSEDSNSNSLEFNLPDEDRWYFVLSNRDSIETTKVVEIDLDIFTPAQPPTVDILSPDDGSNFETGSIIQILGTAQDNNQIEHLNLSLDGGFSWMNITSNLDGINWYYNWYTAGFISGTYQIVVEASDGTSQVQDSITITLGDFQPPDIFIISPSYNSIFDVGELVEINGTVSDNAGITSLEIRPGSDGDWEDIIGNLQDGNWYYHWNTEGLVQGNYMVEVRASDGTNMATDSVSLRLEDPNAEALDVKITYPYYNAHFFLGEVIDLEGTVSGGPPSTLELSLDDGLTWNDITDFLSSGAFSYPLNTSELEVGKYVITVKASNDFEENEYEIIVYIDEALPPEIDVGEDRIVYQGNTIWFFASASYTGGSLLDLTFYWDFDASDGIQMEHTGSWPGVLTTSWQFDEVGEFTVTLCCSDGINEVSDNLTVTVLEHNFGIEVENEYINEDARIVSNGYSVYKIRLKEGEKLHIEFDVLEGEGVYVFMLKGEDSLNRYQMRAEKIEYLVSGSVTNLTKSEDYVFTAPESGTYYLVLDNGYYLDNFESKDEITYDIALKKSKDSELLIWILIILLIVMISGVILGIVIFKRLRNKKKEFVVFEEERQY